MPANTKPLFPLTPNIGIATLTAANTASDGTGTTATLLTAGADGARVDRIEVQPLGTNVATVLRIFLNNGSTSGTASNNSLLKQVRLPATTASNVAENGPDVSIPLDLSLPAGWKVLACLGTAVAAGWSLTAVGGNY
jgi:hypothetical protein